jgi:hypothetical protein
METKLESAGAPANKRPKKTLNGDRPCLSPRGAAVPLTSCDQGSDRVLPTLVQHRVVE